MKRNQAKPFLDRLAEDERKKLITRLRWLGLAIRSLRPFMTSDEWSHFVTVANQMMRRLGLSDFQSGGSKNNEWPKTKAEAWDALL